MVNYINKATLRDLDLDDTDFTTTTVIHVSTNHANKNDDRAGLNKYDALNPYETIQAAIDDAVSGDKIIIHKGLYNTEGITAVDGVDIHFNEGAELNFSTASGVPLVEFPAGVTVNVTGEGVFEGAQTDNNTGVIDIEAGAVINFAGKSIKNTDRPAVVINGAATVANFKMSGQSEEADGSNFFDSATGTPTLTWEGDILLNAAASKLGSFNPGTFTIKNSKITESGMSSFNEFANVDGTGSLTLENCQITTKGFIAKNGVAPSTLTIRRCDIEGEGTSFNGLVDCGAGNLYISHSTMKNNASGNSGGIINLSANAVKDIKVEHCVLEATASDGPIIEFESNENQGVIEMSHCRCIPGTSAAAVAITKDNDDSSVEINMCSAVEGTVWTDPGVKATEDLTFTGQPADTETVTIDGKVYTFQTVLTDVDGNVLIGATTEESQDNLVEAVLLRHGKGIVFADSMTENSTVEGVDGAGTVFTARAKTAGNAGNSIAVSTDITNASWGAGTLSGGLPLVTNGVAGALNYPMSHLGAAIIPVMSSDGVIDSSSLMYDFINHRMAFGVGLAESAMFGVANVTTFPLDGLTVGATLNTHGDDEITIAAHAHNSGTSIGAFFMGLRSRGTHQTPEPTLNLDQLAKLAGAAWNGEEYITAGTMNVRMNGNASIGAVGGAIDWRLCPAGSETLQTVLTLTAVTMSFSDALNMAFNATTGTKIGTATGQKFAFWNATPVVQPAHIADPAGGATVDAEARTAINSILTQLATLGLQAAA